MAAANIPSVKSYDQILGEALATYQSKIGVTDLYPGSAIVSFFESNAQMTYRVTGDIFQILRDYSVDRATGDSLKRLAKEENVTLRPAKAGTTVITITDTSFSKIATKIYPGKPAPNAGTNEIYVGDITGFPSSGSIYIGRGTTNVEGPIVYTGWVAEGSYFKITLETTTLKFHNLSESVILAQGGVRTVNPSFGVQTTSSGGAEPVKFYTTEKTIFLDGENEVSNIPVVASVPSAKSNVPRNSIKEFSSSPPFPQASVTNPSPVTNGRNDEDDESLRIRIKQSKASKGLGTVTAIKSAIDGISASDESATVASSELSTISGQSNLYIDDGNGYERKTSGVGIEYIVDSAIGGETSFQLSTGGSQTGIAKAFLISEKSQPFAISGGQKLSVLVGGIISEHAFSTSDFKSNGNATAFEIAASINANYNLLFKATTASNGTKIVLESKSETDEYLQITSPSIGTDSAPYFNFPSDESETLRLFKNDVALSSNGKTAHLNSVIQSEWSDTITSGETIIISVDGTPEQTYTITDQDFSDNTDAFIVSSNNSLSSWCAVLNAKIPGITATVDGQTFRITSNRQKSSLASISINPSSTFISKNIFSSTQELTSVGSTKDYVFSRNTAQIKLLEPLSAKDKLVAGSVDNLAKLKSGEISGATVNIPSPGGGFWVFVDDPTVKMIATTLFGGQQIFIAPDVNGISISTAANSFSKVKEGDYAILWSDELNLANRIEGRVLTASSTNVIISLTPTEISSIVSETILYKSGIVFVRSESAPQKVSVSSGTFNINDLAETINTNLKNCHFEIEKDSIFVLKTETSNLNTGSLLIPTYTPNLTSLSLPTGIVDYSKKNQTATYETPYDIDYLPAFAHTSLSDRYADPSTSYINNIPTNIDFSLNNIEPNEIISFINGYAGTKSQPLNEIVQIDSYTGLIANIENSEFIKRVKSADRAYIANGYQFGANDSLVVVLDNNPIEKTFIVPFYKELTTKTNYSSNNAFNVVEDLATDLGFGTGFSFDNFKVLLRAKVVLDQVFYNNAILYRAAVWGRSGEFYKISYEYPTTPNSDILHSVSVDKETTIKVFLKSGDIVNSTQSGTTEWNVTITPNTPVPNTDQVTYTWNGTGDSPGLNLSGGEYVKILETGTFNTANTGIFKVSNITGFLPTINSFTVQRKNGEAVAETNVANLVSTTISFYQYSDTSANDIIDYVNTNLSNYVTAEIINDNGTNGTGLLTLSTYEASGFSYSSRYLRDGINWIKSTNLTGSPVGSPQFTLKNNLSYYTDGGYNFNNAEKIRLVPTTPDQVSRLINVPSVTGLSTLAKINTSNKGKKIQISTNSIGALGALQIVGGSANNVTIDVMNTSDVVSSLYGKTDIASYQINSIVSDQLYKITSSFVQNKKTDLSALNTISITQNTPASGQSQISIGSRQINQRLFNIPRTHQTIGGNTWKIEKQGAFTCLSWTGIGNNPNLGNYPINFNWSSADTNINYTKIDSNFLDINVGPSSTISFEEIEIGEYITISGQGYPYDGTFEIQGKSDNQKTIRITNPNAITGTGISDISTFSGIKNIEEGDTVIIDLPFDPLNHGKFRVIRRYENSIYYETTNFKEETVSLSISTNVMGNYSTSYSINSVSNYTELSRYGVLGSDPNFSLLSIGDKITIGAGFSSFNQGTFTVVGVFDDKIQFVNPSSVNETNITPTSLISYYTPAILFFDYDSAIPQDSIALNIQSIIGSSAGSYSILKVLNKSTAIVNGFIPTLSTTLIGSDYSNILLKEKDPYVGYKKIKMVTSEPTNSNLGIIVWENKRQIDKINQSAGTTISSVSKLKFPTANKQGLDAYRYDTGLLAEVNKILYGDPRDRSTYPGVAAAGVEIFVNPPLIKRVSVGIVVRLNTGIPLIQVVEQVRNSVSSLIDGNPIGKSIAISKIVSVVDSIPGITAMAVTSPQYDQNNDLIAVQPDEKTFVIDPATDVSVSQLG